MNLSRQVENLQEGRASLAQPRASLAQPIQRELGSTENAASLAQPRASLAQPEIVGELGSARTASLAQLRMRRAWLSRGRAWLNPRVFSELGSTESASLAQLRRSGELGSTEREASLAQPRASLAQLEGKLGSTREWDAASLAQLDRGGRLGSAADGLGSRHVGHNASWAQRACKGTHAVAARAGRAYLAIELIRPFSMARLSSAEPET